MEQVLIGVRGLQAPEQVEKVLRALHELSGVEEVELIEPGQLQVRYNPQSLTVMDLLRAIREQGFLAGML
jgi:copper chaperone